MKLGLCVWKTSPNCKATVWQQHRAVAQLTLSYLPTLPGMYISWCENTVGFGLWPMQGIRPRHGHLDLSARMGILVGIPSNWVLLGTCVIKKSTERATFPDQTATFRDLKATLLDQSRTFFWCIISHGGRSIFHLSPFKAKFKHVHARANSCNCNKPRIGTWNSLGKANALLG